MQTKEKSFVPQEAKRFKRETIKIGIEVPEELVSQVVQCAGELVPHHRECEVKAFFKHYKALLEVLLKANESLDLNIPLILEEEKESALQEADWEGKINDQERAQKSASEKVKAGIRSRRSSYAHFGSCPPSESELKNRAENKASFDTELKLLISEGTRDIQRQRREDEREKKWGIRLNHKMPSVSEHGANGREVPKPRHGKPGNW